MARVRKSLKTEQGYPHREHRSKRGRKGINKILRKKNARFRRRKEQIKIDEQNIQQP